VIHKKIRAFQPVKLTVEDISIGLYDSQLYFANIMDNQLSSISPVSIGFVYSAGLLTSFSPCAMGLLPLTIAYLGKEDGKAGSKAILYAAGLSATLTLFGLIAAYLGSVYGALSFGNYSSLLTAVISLVMGLNLLEIVSFNFPSVRLEKVNDSINEPWRSLIFGGSSALISSPCSSPVLTSLLAFVSTSQSVTLGSVLLFFYSLGYSTPVVTAGFLSGSAATSFRGAPWVNSFLASLLVSYGTYSLLDSTAKFFSSI